MNAVNPLLETTELETSAINQAIDLACQRIAPTWPLDQLIAVNPWWEMTSERFSEVAARLGALTQAHCLMPKQYFADQFGKTIQENHLIEAVKEANMNANIEMLKLHLDQDDCSLAHWHNISDFLDSDRDRQHKIAWRDEITHQISQFCADYFQRSEFSRAYEEGPNAVYRHWLDVIRHDPGIEILMGESGLTKQFTLLPDNYEQLFHEAMAEMEIDADVTTDYAHALLLDVNGWASWIAYRRWQDKFDGIENQQMQELLAIRMAWELAIWRYQKQTDATEFKRIRYFWKRQLSSLPVLLNTHRAEQEFTWIWQRAAELAFQQELHQALRQTTPQIENTTPQLQAAFCIDVRSEVMRRALESQDTKIQTLGFAGFFGLPIEFKAQGSKFTRPQLPGLLKPTIQVRETNTDLLELKAKERNYNSNARWSEFGDAPPATFSLVEATGLKYAYKLFKDSFFPTKHQHPINHASQITRWDLHRDDKPLTVGEKAELAAGILNAMGLTTGFAPNVLLVGHGSSNCNNPHAAGLDCGACGGQTGEVNARILVNLLNDTQIRDALQSHSITIPQSTRFIAALHDTTTDEIKTFDANKVDFEVQQWLEKAGQTARRERAENLGLKDLDDHNLLKATQQRGKDWSQVRPEWGLANNAAFIVAPRNRTKHIDLKGRSFLHDYQWQNDKNFSVLELIMTAPMLVTHWINTQYNASITDNLKYGSGNKVLHNVVGGHIGVFEGNGGDLRIGLSMQSLHNGERWMHEPLRMSVYIAAPREAISDIIQRHSTVKNLIDNDWLHLFRLDDGATIERYYHREWHKVN